MSDRSDLVSSAPPAAANDRHTRIARRLIDARSSVGQPAVSPDGSVVAYVVATTDLAANTTRSRVWLGDAPLTSGDHDGNPAWSPDGRQLAFTSHRDEKDGETSLHVLRLDRPGQARTLCSRPEEIGNLAWSPNGRWLAFTSRTRHERYSAKDVSWQAPRKIDRFFSRLNGEAWIADRPHHVYLIAADGTQPEPRNLTPGEHQHDGVAWLPDSSAVVTSAARHDTWDRDLAVDLYLVPVADAGDPADSTGVDPTLGSTGAGLVAVDPTGADSAPVGSTDNDGIRCLTGHDGVYGHPSVSPDGSRVAFIGYPDPMTYPQNSRVGVLPVGADSAAHSTVTWVSAGLDRTFEATGGTATPAWVDDRTLLAVAEDRGTQHVFRLTADGRGEPVRDSSGPVVVTALSHAAGVTATTRAEVDRPAELFVDGQRQTWVTDAYARAALGWERFAVPTADGSDEIDAWIMRPAGFDPDQTYPVLLNVHGGPHTQYGETFFDEAQMQAAAGFVVVMSNPRGGSGRHTAWGQAILGPCHPVAPGTGWGGVDVDDVLAVLDAALARHPFCDPARVGMLGGSYGGFMATWLAAHHGHRFKGICTERAVNDIFALEYASDAATSFRTELGPIHLDNAEEYLRHSPITYVRQIDVPLLIIHSEDDLRCPIAQAEQLWVALRLLDKDVDFYRFPGENHELSRSGSPVHRVQRAEIILDWFAAKLAPAGSGS